jgi:hypothetical protein
MITGTAVTTRRAPAFEQESVPWATARVCVAS